MENCEGGHNSKRPRELIVKVGKFLNKYLRGIDEDEGVDDKRETVEIHVEDESSEEEDEIDPTIMILKELNEFSKNEKK